MDRLIIEGIEPYDGEYELALSNLTNGELHRMKKLTGLRVGEFAEAFAALDNDMVMAFAVISLERAGKHVDDAILWAAPAGRIRIDFEEADVSPPDISEPSGSSGDDSTPSSDHPENVQSPTGSQPSGIGATYAQAT